MYMFLTIAAITFHIHIHIYISFEVIRIARQLGYCMGGNFNIHILAWSASPSVQVGR